MRHRLSASSDALVAAIAIVSFVTCPIAAQAPTTSGDQVTKERAEAVEQQKKLIRGVAESLKLSVIARSPIGR